MELASLERMDWQAVTNSNDGFVSHIADCGETAIVSSEPLGVATGMGWHLFRVLDNISAVFLLGLALFVVARLDRDVVLAQKQQSVVASNATQDHPSAGEVSRPRDFQQMAGAPPAAPPIPATPPPEVPDPIDAIQREQYDAVRVKSPIELQQFRRTQTIAAEGFGGRRGSASLINLNPRVNSWFILTLDWGGNKVRAQYHLENPDRRGQTLQLTEGGSGLLTIVSGGKAIPCNLWGGEKSEIDAARATGRGYAGICGGRLYLRNKVQGHYTDLEQMTDFLRENVWNGDAIVGFVKDTVYQDAYKEDGKTGTAPDNSNTAQDVIARAMVKPELEKTTVIPESFGLAVEGAVSKQMQLGRWYHVRGAGGVYASVMRPSAVHPDIVARDKAFVNPLDGVEASALSYLVAFDLGQFEMRYALGTDHPRLNWSARVPGDVRAGNLPGPDGFANPAPLALTGMVGPSGYGRITATFSGGFKREHGAFKWGELSRSNFGSHYGFVENGVVLSKLQPGVSTLYTLDDGSFGMKTWTVEDNKYLGRVAFARQNGVPLVEMGADGKPIAGSLVNRWGPGNWSGSAEAKLRTLRGGACLLVSGGKRYLVYGYFSTGTPSALALVFHSYGCSYAVNLDMNALEHTYLAIYVKQGDTLAVRHLVRSMAGVDKQVGGKLIPRFVGYPDNRDLFYLVRRSASP